jgi:hypothetical protein
MLFPCPKPQTHNCTRAGSLDTLFPLPYAAAVAARFAVIDIPVLMFEFRLSREVIIQWEGSDI